jgi:hypothetical protein
MPLKSPTHDELADLLAEAHAYVQLRAALGLRPDPLCPRMVALRDALNLMPAIDREEEQRMRAIVLRNTRNRSALRIVSGLESDCAYDETDRDAWLGEFPR